MSLSSEIVISIVIPTRERSSTLGYAIATALDQKSDRVEVIVSDNASADETRAVTESFSDRRLRYLNTGRRLSMSDNYEFSLGHVNGRYVIYMGDDDAALPGGVDRLISRIESGPAFGVYMWPLHCYDWPMGGAPARVAHRARLTRETPLEIKQKARFVVANGGWKYYELPCPYHAAVAKDTLDAIRKRTGRVFHSVAPDVFTAMAIPAFVDQALKLDFAVTLNGRSSASNARGFAARSGFPNIEKFLGEYEGYRFHSSLLRDASGAVNMIPDAVLVAKDLFPELYGDTDFNYDAMWAYVCRLRFASYRDVLLHRREIRRSHPFSTARFLVYGAVQEAAVLRRLALDRLSAVGDHSEVAPGDIAQFVKALAGSDDREGHA